MTTKIVLVRIRAWLASYEWNIRWQSITSWTAGTGGKRFVHDDADWKRFVETLAESCAKTGWHVHAHVLMPNHFRLVVETPQPNLVAGMKWFLGTYTARFNRRHKLFGHQFSGRYKSQVVAAASRCVPAQGVGRLLSRMGP